MEKQDLKLVETVESTLTEMVTGDVVKNIIEKQLESTITSIVKSSMESYSDFGKKLKEKINGVVETAVNNVELPEYNKFISNIVINQFDKVLEEQAKAQIQELLNKELGCTNEGLITCSVLQNKIIENFESDEHEEERDINVLMEHSEHGAIYISIKDEEKDERIRVTLYNHHSKDKELYHIGYMESGSYNKRNSRHEQLSLSTYCMDSLERFFYRLYCAQTQINISDSCELESFSVGGYDY